MKSNGLTPFIRRQDQQMSAVCYEALTIFLQLRNQQNLFENPNDLLIQFFQEMYGIGFIHLNVFMFFNVLFNNCGL